MGKQTNTKSISKVLKPLLLLSLVCISYSGLVIPGKKIPILAEDTVVECTDPNLRRASASVPMGRRLIIKLKGNLDSGKGWYIRNFSKVQKDFLVPQNLNSFNSGEFVSNQDEFGRIVKDGFYYFIFKPRRVGKAVLNFAYRRPFQWDSPKNEQFQVSVRVMRNNFDDTTLGCLQEDADANRIYKDYVRKEKVLRSPKKACKHGFRGFEHKYKTFRSRCNEDH